jgi:inositol phosphorylceramide synthase catalytic subunit
MQAPPFPLKLLIPIIWITALLVPLTSQFFLPATPVFSWLITYYSSRYIPVEWRPAISVTILPTLESVLYGGNISDILTRYTHPVLDVMAWLSYGVLHFTLPVVVAIFLWLFAPKLALHYWAAAFGYLNWFGVIVQDIFPCTPPCAFTLLATCARAHPLTDSLPNFLGYEIIYGLIPAKYGTPGSAGGLARIDAIFGAQGYQTAFSTAPVPFGAFPSLHSACATLEALFIGHFFPHLRKVAWGYVAILYWATMYLTHHYLIDVVGGACLAVFFYYAFMPNELRFVGIGAQANGENGYAGIGRGGRSKYEVYDLEARSSSRRNGGVMPSSPGSSDRGSLDGGQDEEQDITFTYAARSPRPPGSAVPFIVPSPIVVAGAESQNGWPRAAGVERVAKSHKHTASIASLIRADERAEGGWSPITTSFPSSGRENRPSNAS